MKDLRFTKEHAYCDFNESEKLENIKSGESLGVIFGKIRTWIKSVKNSAGEKVEGKIFYVNGENVTAKKGAERFNNYIYNKAVGSHSTASGFNTTASYYCSFACGNETTASDYCSFACGNETTASGSTSFACGDGTEASGSRSFACGTSTLAQGSNAFAGGQKTIAKGNASTVIGRWNVTDHDQKFAFIIGNGNKLDAPGVRSNALTVDWEGKIYIGNSTTGINLLDLLSRIEALEAKAESSISEISEEEIDNIC